MGLSKDAKPGGFRYAESTREEEPTSWARAVVELQVCAGPWAAPRAHSSVPRSPFPALQDEATSAFSPTSPLGPGVLLPAPLAVGPVHSLPQEAGSEATNWAAGQFDTSGNVTTETGPRPLPQQV